MAIWPGGLWYKTIAKASHRYDMSRFLPVFFNFPAEPVDINHNGVVINSYAVPPYMFVNHIFGKHLVRMFHKQKHQMAMFFLLSLIQRAITRGVFKLFMVFFGAFVTIIVIALYLVRLLLQRRKDIQEIAYLTELNQILEEMYQSEETLAHQQRLQIIGTMTGGVTHEFNNLLTPIMGYAELLLLELTESDNPDLYDYAEEIYEASAKAKEIIQQISSLSRKNMETVYKNINAEKILKRAIKMVVSVCPATIRLIEDIDFKNVYILGNETL